MNASSVVPPNAAVKSVAVKNAAWGERTQGAAPNAITTRHVKLRQTTCIISLKSLNHKQHTNTKKASTFITFFPALGRVANLMDMFKFVTPRLEARSGGS